MSLRGFSRSNPLFKHKLIYGRGRHPPAFQCAFPFPTDPAFLSFRRTAAPHLPSHRKPEALKSKAERKFLRKPALCIKWASSLRSPLRSICGSPLFCHFLSYHWIYIKNMLHGIFCFCKGFIQSLTFLAGPQIFPFVFFYFLVAFICPGILSFSAVKNFGAFLPAPETFENPLPVILSVPAADTLRIAPFSVCFIPIAPFSTGFLW